MGLVRGVDQQAHRQDDRMPRRHALDFVGLDKEVQVERVAVPDAEPYRREEVDIFHLHVWV
jgi:hypothetical protein